MQHQAKVQFQSNHDDIVPSVYSSNDDTPLRASQIVQMLDTLANNIRSSVSDSRLRDKAIDEIKVLKDQIQDAARYGGISGKGMGRNTRKREFYYDGREYRVDLELSGDIRD